MAVLEDLDSRLSVGMQYADYVTRVGDAKSAVDRVTVDPIADADAGCRAVAYGASLAVANYAESARQWQVAIEYPTISADYERKMRDGWAIAGRAVSQARDALGQMRINATNAARPSSP